MLTFKIVSSQSLLSELVAAIVREQFADAEIAVDVDHRDFPDGVAVSLAENQRWLFLASAPGPSPAMAQALSSGACAVLNVGSRRSELARAMACLTSPSGTYVPIELLRWMANEVLGQPTGSESQVSPAGRLTVRERSVLGLVARGYSNFEIATELTISENTVRTHLHALSVKFGASSRAKMLANARALHVPEAFERPVHRNQTRSTPIGATA